MPAPAERGLREAIALQDLYVTRQNRIAITRELDALRAEHEELLAAVRSYVRQRNPEDWRTFRKFAEGRK